MANKNVADRNGYYTRGKAQFKVTKGAFLPAKGTYDDIFLFDEEEESGSTLTGQMSDRIAADQAAMEEDFSVESLADERQKSLEVAEEVRQAVEENPELTNEEVEEITLAAEGIEEDQAEGVETASDEAPVEDTTAKPRRGGNKNK